jgi:FkbM family methyltransferase
LTRGDLIIDVGMHVGHDSEFYLAKGFNVVAVEANPDLVADAETKFARELADGRLRIFAVAIAEQRGTASLAVARDHSGYSSLSASEVQRAEQRGVSFEHIDVPTVPFEDVLAEVGVPYYLKVDIEGLDRLCVRALRRFDERPAYVSIESSITNAKRGLGFAEIFDELDELWKLGYTRFKYINQMRASELPNPPLEGSRYAEPVRSVQASGPFGKETPGRWEPIATTILRGWSLRMVRELGARDGRLSRLPPGRLYRGLERQARGSHGRDARAEPARDALPRRLYREMRSHLLTLPIGFYDLHARLGTIE